MDMGAKMWFIHVCTKLVKMIACLVLVLGIIFSGHDTFLMHPMCILTSNLTKWWRSCSNIGRNSSLCVPKREWTVSEILLSIYTSSSSYEMNTKTTLYYTCTATYIICVNMPILRIIT